jgi:hypothetical protein
MYFVLFYVWAFLQSRCVSSSNPAIYEIFLLIAAMVESARFDITNTESLLRKISTEDLKAFNFDVKCIDWAHYFSNVHVPGVVKYVLK